MTERAKPRGDIFKKLAPFAAPIILLANAACGTTILDANMPPCYDDPQPKTKKFTLSLNSILYVDGVKITATSSDGTIDTYDSRYPNQLPVHRFDYVDGHLDFQGNADGRHYSIKAEPTPPDIGKGGTIVTVQGDCGTLQVNPQPSA